MTTGSLQTRTATCATCGRAYDIPSAERAYYANHGYREPVNCRDCRERLRADRQSVYLEVEDGGRSRSRLGTYGGVAPVAPRPAEMSGRFIAVCSSCGGEAVVPFKPRPGRPVYCRACFNAARPR